jgi:hypothetical protein
MNSHIHKDYDQTDNKLILKKRNKNTFTVFYQNMCGLLNKNKKELLNPLTKHSPQIIYVSEHHLNGEELEGITLHSYTLGAKFCRRIQNCGRVYIYIQNNIYYNTINMDRYSK